LYNFQESSKSHRSDLSVPLSKLRAHAEFYPEVDELHEIPTRRTPKAKNPVWADPPDTETSLTWCVQASGALENKLSHSGQLQLLSAIQQRDLPYQNSHQNLERTKCVVQYR